MTPTTDAELQEIVELASGAEISEVVRVASAVYLKVGIRNAPDVYPAGCDVASGNNGAHCRASAASEARGDATRWHNPTDVQTRRARARCARAAQGARAASMRLAMPGKAVVLARTEQNRCVSPPGVASERVTT